MAQIKGTGMLNVIKGLKVQSKDALGDLPEPLKRYLDEKILVASWYPADDFLALLRFLCKILPAEAMQVAPEETSTDDPWEWIGRRVASIDLVEIYSSMVVYGRPWRTLERFPRLWRLYFDTGHAEVAIAGDREARVELREFPFAEEDAYCRHLAGYLYSAMRVAGARDVQVRVSQVARGGDPACWSITWGE